MTRIPAAGALPAEPPAQKKIPAAPASAPPFTPARPRQAASPPPHAAQARQPQARHARQARTPDQREAPSTSDRRGSPAAEDERTPPFQTAGDRQTETGGRLVGENSLAAGRFFDGFGQPDNFAQRDGSAALQVTVQITLQETLRGTRYALDALDQELDSAELARLLPAGGNDGIFDVMLPTGERLGVVVSGQSSSLSYLLSPSTDQFGSRLRRQRMELEQRMERLTHRNVNITVL
jgi:hypothetical protein